MKNGKWLNGDEYITVHRIAGDGKKKGIFTFTISYCKRISDNIRIDTHQNNQIMQKLIEKKGFQKCGTIFGADGLQESPTSGVKNGIQHHKFKFFTQVKIMRKLLFR